MREHFGGYLVGVMSAVEFLITWHDRPSMAADLCRQLAHGQSLDDLKRAAAMAGAGIPNQWWIEELKWPSPVERV